MQSSVQLVAQVNDSLWPGPIPVRSHVSPWLRGHVVFWTGQAWDASPSGHTVLVQWYLTCLSLAEQSVMIMLVHLPTHAVTHMTC